MSTYVRELAPAVVLTAVVLISMCAERQADGLCEIFPKTGLPPNVTFDTWNERCRLLQYLENVTENGVHYVRIGQATYSGRQVDLRLVFIEFDTPEAARQRLDLIANDSYERYSFHGAEVTAFATSRDAALCDFEPERPCWDKSYYWIDGRYLFGVISLGTEEETALDFLKRAIDQTRTSRVGIRA